MWRGFQSLTAVTFDRARAQTMDPPPTDNVITKLTALGVKDKHSLVIIKLMLDRSAIRMRRVAAGKTPLSGKSRVRRGASAPPDLTGPV